MKRFPTGFTCLTVDKSCPWFTVGKTYNAVYKDDRVSIRDDVADLEWKLTKVSGIWSIEIQNHVPGIVATFNEQD